MTDPRQPGSNRGFTLLEVLIAVAILSLSLTSLLSSQMASMRATSYARGVSVAAFLAEHRLMEIEWEMQRDGWIAEDKTFEGDFSEEGWPDIRYECLVDFMEMPDYSQIQQAVDASEQDETGVVGQDAGEQAFGALGMVWPIVKAAIEQSIRKAECTVFWPDGAIQHDFKVQTYWTDPQQLSQLPSLGGERTDADDDSSDDPPGGNSPPSGRGPGGGRGPVSPGGVGMGGGR